MHLTFIGNPLAKDETDSVTLFGVTFVKGVSTLVSDPHAIAKLSNHSHFRVDDGVVEPEIVADVVAQVAVSKRVRGQRRSED